MARTRRNDQPQFPKVLESYQEPRLVALQDEPSAFNGMIRLRRYRITVDIIDEPVEILRERLVGLWRSEPYNSHLTDAFHRAACELGIELDPRERAKRDDTGF